MRNCRSQWQKCFNESHCNHNWNQWDHNVNRHAAIKKITRNLCYRKVDRALYTHKWIEWAVAEMWPFEIIQDGDRFSCSKTSSEYTVQAYFLIYVYCRLVHCKALYGPLSEHDIIQTCTSSAAGCCRCMVQLKAMRWKLSLLVADVKRRAVSCYSLVTLLWGKQDVKRAVTLSVCAWRHAAIRFHLTSRASMRRWLFDLRLLWWLWELCSGDSSLTSRLIRLNRPGYSPNSRHRTAGGINHTRTGLAIVPLCARKKYI